MSFSNDIKATAAFTARNIKLFFKDKGTLISAMIAPLVILLLYVLFLHGVLKSSFASALPETLELSEKSINGYIASFEVSSILAVCCVTVAFIANMSMVDDKVTGVRADLDITPVKGRALVLGYYFSTAIVTLVVCYVVMLVGFVYIAVMGWQMTVGDTFAVIADVFLCTLFGTAVSSIVCVFLKSRGAINAVSTVVSTVYGFICGAYYPVSQFSKGIANTVMCLPGTYCTGLLRAHFMGAYAEVFADAGIPEQAVGDIMKSFDAKMLFFDKAVPIWVMYTVVCCTIVALIGIFVLINAVKIKKRKAKIKT